MINISKAQAKLIHENISFRMSQIAEGEERELLGGICKEMKQFVNRFHITREDSLIVVDSSNDFETAKGLVKHYNIKDKKNKYFLYDTKRKQVI